MHLGFGNLLERRSCIRAAGSGLDAAIGAGLAMYALERNGVERLWSLSILLLAMWYAMLLSSGVHATIAGVVGAFLNP